jgi:hypothetical protein
MPSVKEIYHKIDDVRIEADSINLNVDGLEALASTQQADIADIKADLANGVLSLGTKGSITTRSGTITTGGTSQQVAASNSSRVYFAIQNISDTDMYLGIGYTPTTTTGILLTKSGGGFVFESGFIPTQAINLLCATTGKAFVAWEA